MKLLISLIGTSKIVPVRVTIDWNRASEIGEADPHHQMALRRAIAPDRCWLVGTPEALQMHGGIFADADLVEIPMGRSNAEFWTIYTLLRQRLETLKTGGDDWEIHLDLTNGFRIQPMFLLAAVRYTCLLSSDRMRIADVYYNAFEREKAESPLLRVSPILEMEAVASDIDVFLSHAAAGPLVERLRKAERERSRELDQQLRAENLSQREHNRRMGALREGDPSLALLAGVIKALDAFGAVTGINHTPTAARVTRDLFAYAETAEQILQGALAPVGHGLGVLRAGLKTLLPSDPKPLWGWHSALAKWCLNRGLIQQALTHAREMLITRACEEAGEDPLVLKVRERIGRPIEGMGRLDGPPCTPAWADLHGAWSSVVEARNRANHAFTGLPAGEHGEAADPAKIRGDFEKRVTSLLEMAENVATLPPIPE